MAGLKRYFAFFIIFLVIGVNSLSPFSVYALDEIPTDTPTPIIEQQTDPTPTPTITSTPPPTETIDNTTQTNSTEAHDSTTGDSNTGTNISTASAELNPKGIEEAIPTSNTTGSQETSSSVITTQDGLNSSVTTSNSTTIVAIDNTVNTNSVNSQVINQTINIFVDNEEDIDLSTPFTLAYTIISQDKNIIYGKKYLAIEKRHTRKKRPPIRTRSTIESTGSACRAISPSSWTATAAGPRRAA
jgi:hypothetical protein